ncbi:putative MFS-type transporter YhjX [Bradyrhizobium ivorense]|uniref:MFS-type transporter YhjX n=1 Tax=Bradyrhizobium ivorense TaxID=2511166 RepID=A0A508TNS3_9BRAD|nr:MFS transporter [Bradyrhizobium ivorense]VIO75856.1 putative MFS-type transporter YhjX [Bradyrhizobium ivorense]
MPAEQGAKHWQARLPFYYGWLIVAIAFVTMAIGVTGRTAFSLLLPPLIDEFKWDRGLAAGAFSFGFLVSAVLSPIVGRVMDARGPRIVILSGVALMSAGLLLAPWIASPWQLYATLGVAVGGGANMMTYTAHSQFLPNWFVRRRGLAISIAFAGAGVGAVLLLPWLQGIILTEGWRASCVAMGWLVLLGIAPLALLVRKGPADVGQNPDGDKTPIDKTAGRGAAAIVDPAWAATEWTLGRALRTFRFWCIALGYFLALIAWYAVQVHQTKYLVEIGFSPLVAAWALGAVSVIAIPGQILLGGLSDRIGREWIWTAGCLGFVISYAALLALEFWPSHALLYAMVFAQGFFGYALTSVMGPIVAEIFEGPHYGAIFGTITIALIGGGAAGPWMAGVIHDATGSYRLAFVLIIAFCLMSAVAIWIAGPRHVRLVPGRVPH